MKVVCFYLYKFLLVAVLLCIVNFKAFAALQLNQVAFQTDWLDGAKRDEYVRTHYASAGQLVVLDFELKVSEAMRITSIDVVLDDTLKLSQTWRKQIRIGAWNYQKQPTTSQIVINANQLIPIKQNEKLIVRAERGLRINVLLWTDYSVKPAFVLGKLKVNFAKNQQAQALFSVNKLGVSLPLLEAPIGVFEHRFDFSRHSRGGDRLLNACVALFAQQMGLKHLVDVGRSYVNRRNRLVDIKAAEQRFANQFFQYFNGYPYEQTDILNYDILARLHQSLSLRQFAYLNAKLQQAYERQLPLPDTVANEYLWLLQANKQVRFAEFRSLLADNQTLNDMAVNLENAREHPMANSMLFEKTSNALGQLFFGMYNLKMDLSEHNVRTLKFKGKQPWLLNAQDKRAAGWFLWRANLHGYMQWQPQLRGRLPNSGSKALPMDAQFYYLNEPMNSQQCIDNDGAMLAIDSQWLSIALGAVDRRWILWLQQMAHDKGSKRQQAQHLLASMTEKVPASWQLLKQLALENPQYLYLLRAEIAEFSMR